MFVGRQYELEQLDEAYHGGGFVFAAIYGRRYIGKTSLISEFIKDKEAIYFSARELTDKYNLEAFTKTIAEHFGISAEGIDTWEAAFHAVHNHSADRRLILILDNYTDACLTNRELSAVIAGSIAKRFKDSKLFLILCGSHMTAIEREVIGKDSALKEHLTLSLQIKGLPFEDACAFMDGYHADDKRKLYECIGGTPLYLSLMDNRKTADENISDLFLNRSGFIYNDMEMALQKELIGPAVYNALLRAVAHGKHKSKDILAETGEKKSKAHKYLNVLISMGILYRAVPEGEDPLVSRKGTYHFEDNAYRFWYKYVLDNIGRIDCGLEPEICGGTNDVSN